MTDELPDCYSKDLFCVPIGENHFQADANGWLTFSRKAPEERSGTWKGSRRIQALPNSAVVVLSVRENGKIYYGVEGVTVTYSAARRKKYACHTHNVNDCPHVRLVRRYRKENAA